jgi:hypothetical protein
VVRQNTGIVDAGDRGLVAANVVENCLDDMWLGKSPLGDGS